MAQHTEVFQSILAQIELDKIPTEFIPGLRLGKDINVDIEVTVCALNIVLVLAKARLSYRCDVYINDDNQPFADTIVAMSDQLISIPFSSEPLICLKESIKDIFYQLKECKDPEMGLGKVLGYSYIGTDWQCQIRDCYAIGYNATDQEGKKFRLYNFNVPVEKYTAVMKATVLSIEDKYHKVLKPYGYDVRAVCSFHAKNGFPEEMEALPN